MVGKCLMIWFILVYWFVGFRIALIAKQTAEHEIARLMLSVSAYRERVQPWLTRLAVASLSKSRSLSSPGDSIHCPSGQLYRLCVHVSNCHSNPPSWRT